MQATPVQVMDGHVRERPVVPVDAPHDLVHHAAQPLHQQPETWRQSAIATCAFMRNNTIALNLQREAAKCVH